MQEFNQRSWAQKIFTAAFIVRRTEFGVGFFQVLGERIVSILGRTFSEGSHSGITDGPIAGAAAEITSKLFVKIVVRVKIIAIVTLEHRADEARRAIAALRTKMLDHLLLHGVLLCGTTNTFDRHDFASSHQTDGHDATVHRAIGGLTI